MDRLQEIWETVRKHKLRTLLTCSSVAWGVFMLVILLGFGAGLQNSVEKKFVDDATNSIWMHRGKTSIPYRGLKPGRQVEFTNRDLEAIKQLAGVEYITGRYYLWGDHPVRYGNKTSAFDIRAVHPDHLYLEKTIITQGRYVNDRDIDERRKVAVIGPDVKEFLFGPREALGEYIEIAGSPYRVVGMFEDEGGEGEQQKIFIPVTTAQRAYNAGDQLHGMMFTVGDASVAESQRIELAVRHVLAERQRFSPDDERAVRMRNNVEQFQKLLRFFDLIRVIVWIVGIGTLVAGVIGVSNIMLISVAERTVEFGVRKALGATPWSIVSSVVLEAVALTAVAGYLGIVVGVGALELFGWLLAGSDMIENPQVDLGVVVSAALILVAFGALAGYFPARRAARVNPVVALRSE